MTYNEWRDELKSNLLCVSEGERRRVLDYYAEAYADRRDAGYTEREIIEDFGAPYDAAQRILAENAEPRDMHSENGERSWRQVGARFKNGLGTQFKGINTKLKNGVDHLSEKMENSGNRDNYYDESGYYRDNYAQQNQNARPYTPPPAPAPQPAPEPEKPKKKREDYTWVFVLLCVIFCVPLFGIIMSMVGVTIGVCATPFALLVSGVATIGSAIGTMVGGAVLDGVCELGIGIIIFGVSIILIPLFVKLIKLMWQLFGKLFGWIKSLFSGKEKA